jgi:hypothetical protein
VHPGRKTEEPDIVAFAVDGIAASASPSATASAPARSVCAAYVRGARQTRVVLDAGGADIILTSPHLAFAQGSTS